MLLQNKYESIKYWENLRIRIAWLSEGTFKFIATNQKHVYLNFSLTLLYKSRLTEINVNKLISQK